MSQYLVLLDVPSIKRYVFGTDKLVEIRGASSLLAKLNERVTPEILGSELGRENVDCVFSGGGAGQFIISSDDDRLNTALKGLQRRFLTESNGGLALSYGLGSFQGNDYPKAIEDAFQDLRRKRGEECVRSVPTLHTGFIRECDSCSEMAAQRVTYADESRWLCNVCAKKVEAGRGRGLWAAFARHLSGRGVTDPENLMPGDFESIGERCRARTGYTALVYADGNAMGRMIQDIETKDQFRYFSETVDSAVKEACHEAMAEICVEVRGKVPANILLLGGDDLVVYLAADVAMPFVIDAARRFEEKTRTAFSKDRFFSDRLGGRGITLSFGIAYGKSHTPFSIMMDQAEELLKSAKKAGSELLRTEGGSAAYAVPTYIDYHMTSHFNQISVQAARKAHLEFSGPNPVKLTRKPYSLDEAESLLSHAKAIVASGIPRSRLKRFGYAPFFGKVDGTLECLKLYTRIRGEDQRLTFWSSLSEFDCITNMPWQITTRGGDVEALPKTVLTDLIEIVEFC